MILDKTLHRIELGEATPKEARKAIRELLQTQGGGASLALYTALRSWTWSALQNRRFDDELSEWYAVIQAAGSALRGKDAAVSHYLQALAHLIDDSVRYGAANTHDQLLGRSHLGEILEIIRLNNGCIERAILAAKSGLNNSRLSQLLTDLVSVGLLEREQEGRKAWFSLTHAGFKFLDRWQVFKKETAVAAEASAKARKPIAPPELTADALALEFVHWIETDARAGDFASIWIPALKSETTFVKEPFLLPVELSPDDLWKKANSVKSPANDTDYPVPMISRPKKEVANACA